MGMSRVSILLPISTRTLRILLVGLGVFLLAVSLGSFSEGQFSDGPILVSAGGIAFLVSVVYLSEWYENSEYGLRIIELIFGVAAAGGVSGLVL